MVKLMRESSLFLLTHSNSNSNSAKAIVHLYTCFTCNAWGNTFLAFVVLMLCFLSINTTTRQRL